MVRERFDQAEGRPFGICRNVRQSAEGGGGHRGSAGGRVSFETRAKPATGPGLISRQPKGCVRTARPVRACGGHDVLDVFHRPREFGADGEASIQRSGSVPESRNPHSRSVQAAAVATRAESPEEGQVDKPAPCAARRRLSDADIIRRDSGRARAAPPILLTIPEAKPACGPPDYQLFSHPGDSVARDHICMFQSRRFSGAALSPLLCAAARYAIDMTSSSCSLTSTTSPTALPISARATGEAKEMVPVFGSASSSPTMR